MKSFSRRRAQRALGVAGLAAATLFAFGSFAQAVPEGTAVIKACVNKKTGDVRILDLPRGGGPGCGKQEQSVVWNVKGPRGPQGPQGPQGPPGPATPPEGFSARVSTSTPLPPGPGGTVLVIENLPAGTYQATAALDATRIGSAPVFLCRLSAGTTGSLQVLGNMGERDVRPGVPNELFNSTAAVTGQATVPANGRIQVDCNSGAGDFTAGLTAHAVTPPAP